MLDENDFHLNNGIFVFSKVVATIEDSEQLGPEDEYQEDTGPKCYVPCTGTTFRTSTTLDFNRVPLRPSFPVPRYVKSNDFATMRSCHLNGK
jgi:hypothetical protein